MTDVNTGVDEVSEWNEGSNEVVFRPNDEVLELRKAWVEVVHDSGYRFPI